jgi:LPPG:FO 2-phospho-L-lactate transferase
LKHGEYVASRIAVLCGGLGGSRFVHAAALAWGGEQITAIGNVGDDLEFLGLHVSPDLDTVLYTLAGLLDESRGWGVRDETYSVLGQAERLGADTWFTLGDRDIGLHVVRTERLRRGEPLSLVMADLARSLGVAVKLVPATDDRLRTIVLTDAGELDFQTWFVGRGHQDAVRALRYEGAETSRPAPGVLEAIANADAVIIAPSNPFVSIAPILAVPAVREAIRAHPLVAAISPLVAGEALRGPLPGMMRSLGHEASALGVARLYAELGDVFILDTKDEAMSGAVGSLGLRPVVSPTVMVDPAARAAVGRAILEEVLG